MTTKLTLTISLLVLCLTSLAQQVKPRDRIVLAYITSGNNIMPDPALVTHINYAFGTVNKSFDGVNVQNPERLHKIVALKKTNRRLRIMLSIGGWGSGGFSEMASVDSLRAAFVADCARITDEFGLDGIDMDWEYPSSSSSGIASKPEDVDNFTKLMRELREALGKKRLVTFATSARARHIDFPAVMPYCDFVNIMAYDMGRPPRHNAALYPSDQSRFSASQAIDAHIAAGVPPDRLVLGVPFYGHGNTKKGVSDYVDYRGIGKFDKYTHLWDSTACVPYVVDEQGDMIVTYDSPQSLAMKCEYAIGRGLLGVMYWEYACDNDELSLARATYNATVPNKKK